MSILPLLGLEFKEDLSYEEVAGEILDRQFMKLRNKEVCSVKVLWRNHLIEGVIFKADADIRTCYPYSFPRTPTKS